MAPAHFFTPGYTHKPLRHSPISVNPNAITHPSSPSNPTIVSPKLWSGFLEHLGRCIYGGIVDCPNNPADEKLLIKQDDLAAGGQEGRLGWRKDVMELIGRDGELQTGYLRWPGGNFVSNYHWQDGIGPIADRPGRVELAWLSSDTNKFGTDEFIDYCRGAGVEPYICLNMGSGTMEEALAWVEYCNGTGNTHWANLRRKNTGRDEPHNVKLWGLGNEMWGPWQVGNMEAGDYVKLAKRWAHAVKLVDPEVKLVSCGIDGHSEWDRLVIKGLMPFAEYHSLHMYTVLAHEKIPGIDATVGKYEMNVFGTCAAEKSIDIAISMIEKASLGDDAFGHFGAKKPTGMKLCYDEWNVWDEEIAPGKTGLEQKYNLTDALGVCGWLNILVRKSKHIEIACIAQTVNVISPILTSPTGMIRQSIFYPFSLFSRYMKGGELLDLSLTSNRDVYDGPTFYPWIQWMMRPTYIDTVAMILKQDGNKASIRISVLNRHPESAWTGGLMVNGFNVESAEVHELYHDDLEAVNTFEDPDVVKTIATTLSASEWEAQGPKWSIKKHSWSFFILNGIITDQ